MDHFWLWERWFGFLGGGRLGIGILKGFGVGLPFKFPRLRYLGSGKIPI
jgi:hypothetical protein